MWFISVILAVALLWSWYALFGGHAVLRSYLSLEYVENFLHIVFLITALSVLYELSAIALKPAMMKAGAKEGEVSMILGVVKAAFIFVGVLTAASYWFSLGTLGTIFAAFGGMFLGWSLQAPISGLAAWFLVSIIRPFSVGDRVQLPSYGMVGDVVSVSPLYTVLNQVGGSVGSEEPANRTILIPNAMLFSALVINYTPKGQEKLMEVFRKRFETQEVQRGSSYMLDEFVLRMTFDSDWDEAEKILLNAAQEITADIIKDTGQEPYIRADMGDWYGVNMRLRFMTLATERPRILHELAKKIFKEIQVSKKIDLAIPQIYSFKKGLKWAPPSSLERLETLRRIGRDFDEEQNLAEEWVLCPDCKTENPSNAVYCNKCGKKISGIP